MPSDSIHSRFADLATRLIDKHGRTMILVRINDEGSTPWNPTQTEQYRDIVGVQSKFTSSEIDGELIRSTDKLFLIDTKAKITTAMRIRDYGPGVDLIPLGEWEAGIDGFGVPGDTQVQYDYSIVNIEEVKPGNTSILYKVQVRL